MANITTDKREYVEHWFEHIHELYALGTCNDDKLSAEVFAHIKALEALVHKVADTKDLS